MFAHCWNKVGNSRPITGDPEEPLKYGMRGIELVVECLIMSIVPGKTSIAQLTR
jgi:hypothetical protein